MTQTRKLLLGIVAVLSLSVAFSSATTESEATDTEDLYRLEGTVKIPKPGFKVSAGTRILVNSGAFIAIPKQDGSFAIDNVPPGSHLLEVINADFLFAPIRIDISSKEKGKVRAVHGLTRTKVAYPLVLKPEKSAEYFQKHVPYDWTSLLKNPMVIMLLFTGVLVLIMPKMINNMDPKDLEQMKKMSLVDIMKGKTLEDRRQ